MLEQGGVAPLFGRCVPERFARDLGVDPRIAAYVLALGRVAAVTELRGIWP